jgi:signal transduction histidine kinase
MRATSCGLTARGEQGPSHGRPIVNRIAPIPTSDGLRAPAQESKRGRLLSRLRRSPLLRSAGLRFAALYAIIFGLSALALAIFLWWATAGLLNRQVEAAINADAQGLGERYEEGGIPALILTIQDRLSQSVDENAIYLLADGDLHPIAGNLDIWPMQVSASDSWFELVVRRGDHEALARIHRYDLPGGFHLLIGRDIGSRAKLRSLLTAGLLWALLVMVVLGSAGALAIQSLFKRSLADVSATADAISRGDLSNRVRISGRGDEFDRLAETINDMLDRIARLMDGVRQVSNAIAHDLRTPITRARARLEDAALHARDASDLHAAIWTASSRSSRDCSASRRSRRGRAARPSPRSMSMRCSPICTSFTARRRRSRGSRSISWRNHRCRCSEIATCCNRRWRTCSRTP